jgi:hypothetical protein
MKTILELADDYAKAYFMGRGEEARKLLQAAIISQEILDHGKEIAAFRQGYLSGLDGDDSMQIAVDMYFTRVPSTSDQLREEYASGLDSPDDTEKETP